MVKEKNNKMVFQSIQNDRGTKEVSKLRSELTYIERPVYQMEDLHKESLYEVVSTSVRGRTKTYLKSIQPVECLLNTVPLLRWLPQYGWKKDFISDFISGLTVGIMHIPQGMALGLIANVPPITGIYAAFFPVLPYLIFGTSKHVAIGLFAVLCLMSGKVVTEQATIEIMQNGTIVQLLEGDLKITAQQVAATLSFGVAILQLAMYGFRLGAISSLLSDPLASGFTCAAAFHIISSQLMDFFGVAFKKRQGNFNLVFTVYDVIVSLPSANLMVICMSTICCIMLVLNDEVIKPRLGKKCRMPFPMELVCICLGTAVTYYSGIHDTYKLSVVGYIPRGLPPFEMPEIKLLPIIWIDTIVITIVSYTITMSMSLIFARQFMYEIDSNQELLALGLSNGLGSFFSCLPVSASLSRSSIQVAVGGVSQIASVVNCVFLLFVLLWMAPAFQTLPRCILAATIIISLKGLTLQVRDFPRMWRLSRWDGFVWAVTFLTTLLVQISVGLAAGIAASLVSVVAQSVRLRGSVLGRLPGTDLYLEMERNRAVVEVPGVKIVHFVGGLSFASKNVFRDLFVQEVGLDPAAILRERTRLREKGVAVDETETILTQGIIVDFSSLTFLDPSGVELLRQLKSELEMLSISFFITGCSSRVYETILKCEKWEKKPSNFMVFATIHDAAIYVQSNIA